MKFKIYTIITFIATVSLASCSKEYQIDAKGMSNNGTALYPVNSMVIGNQTMNVKNAMIQEKGNSVMFGNAPTHFTKEFIFSDGDLMSVDSNEPKIASNGTMKVTIKANCLGTNAFMPGTYEYVNGAADSTLNAKELKSKYSLKHCFDLIVQNNAGKMNSKDNTLKVAKLQVTGTSPKYSLVLEGITESGKNVRFSFSGNFSKL